MRHFNITILIFFLLLNIASSQEQKQSAEPQSTRRKGQDVVSALLDSAKSCFDSDPAKAVHYVEKALEKSIGNRNIAGEADCYRILGDLNYNLQQYDISSGHYEKAFELFGMLRDPSGQYGIRLSTGMAYEAMQKFDSALENYKAYLKTASDNENTADIIRVKNRMASVYRKQGKDRTATATLLDVLEIEKKRTNINGIIVAYENLGKLYLEFEKPEEARKCFENSKKMAEEINDSYQVSNSMLNISNTLRQGKNYDEELEVRQQSLEYNELNPNKIAQTIDNREIGNIYMEQNNNEAAIPYLKKSVELSDEIGDLAQKGEALKSLSTAYDKSGEYKKAIENYEKYVVNVDSMYRQKEKELLAYVDIKTTLNQKLERIDFLEKDRKIRERTINVLKKEQLVKDNELKAQKIAIYSLIAGLLVLVLASFFVYRSLRQKRRANQLLALKSLRNQMNPHFIFNALNSVNSFISKSDERSANKYLSDFSRLMRMVLENSKHDFVSLSNEITVLRLYLNLEHFRFKEKFDYSFDVDPAIEQDSFEIPTMLIQPYIENAIWHGLRYKEDKGFLNVQLFRDNRRLKVLIEDNGIGRRKSRELKTKNQLENESTGMKNIESRVKILNEVHRKSMDVKVEDLNSDGTGTRVTIMIYGNSISEE